MNSCYNFRRSGVYNWTQAFDFEYRMRSMKGNWLHAIFKFLSFIRNCVKNSHAWIKCTASPGSRQRCLHKAVAMCHTLFERPRSSIVWERSNEIEQRLRMRYVICTATHIRPTSKIPVVKELCSMCIYCSVELTIHYFVTYIYLIICHKQISTSTTQTNSQS